VNRDRLHRHLVDHRIAGDVATPRASNVRNVTAMLDRHPDYWFGIELDRDWTPPDVLKVLADRVGLDPDPSRVDGGDRIDPERTLEALDAAAELITDAARRRARVLFATGHPTGVLAWHLIVAARLAAAGCEILTPAAGAPVRPAHADAAHAVAGYLHPRARIRYLGGVAMLSNGADFLHTHAAEPMQLALEAGAWPDLVVADHGWAGVAAQAGIPVVALADTNDPALFVGAEEGKVAVAVPLDDNVDPALYHPLADYVVRHLPSTAGR
jgi:hypothetical protein